MPSLYPARTDYTRKGSLIIDSVDQVIMYWEGLQDYNPDGAGNGDTGGTVKHYFKQSVKARGGANNNRPQERTTAQVESR